MRNNRVRKYQRDVTEYVNAFVSGKMSPVFVVIDSDRPAIDVIQEKQRADEYMYVKNFMFAHAHHLVYGDPRDRDYQNARARLTRRP